MSLFTDLRDVFTAYAQRIKGLAAADEEIKADLDDLNERMDNLESGMSNTAKVALLNCFKKVAWVDEYGQTYYDALEQALYPNPIDLISITATFNQGENVISATDKIADLKQFLVVTANYSDGSQETLSKDAYTLSGSLVVGTATINVMFEDKTTTFSCAVSSVPSGYTVKNYVQADGTQYIMTSIPETSAENWWFRYKTAITEKNNKANHTFSSNNFFLPYLTYYSDSSYDAVNVSRYGMSKMMSYPFSTNTEYEIEAYRDGDNINVNGVSIGSLTAGSTHSSSNMFAIMTYAGNVASSQWRLRGKLYYLKAFTNNGIKAHDFIPCLNSSNVAGLYDLVDGVFYPPTVGTLVTD